MPEQQEQAPQTVALPVGKLRLLVVQSALTAVVVLLALLIKWMGGSVFEQLSGRFRDSMNDNAVMSVIAAWMDGNGPLDALTESGAPLSDPSEETSEEASEQADVSVDESSAEPSNEPPPESSSEDEVAAMAGVTSLPEDTSAAMPMLERQAEAPLACGTVTSAFGYRDNPTGSGAQFHYGLDIAASEGTPIAAMLFGVVCETGSGGSYGNYVRIYHGDGVSVLYAHCSRVLVSEGDAVMAGETVAEVGATGDVTGNHVHIEVEQDGTRCDPATLVPMTGYTYL